MKTIYYDSQGLMMLKMAARTFDDVQKLRITTSNRKFQLGENHPALFDLQVDHLKGAEETARKILRGTYLQYVSPAVKQWVKDTKGVGEHLAALLLAETGDPAVARPKTWCEDDEAWVPDGDPYLRTYPELVAYCGMVPGRKKAKGMSQEDAKALGRPWAKRTLRLLAESQLKSNGPYRALYDTERAKATAKGWTDGHGHNHALRVVAKRILRGLYEARLSELRSEQAAA